MEETQRVRENTPILFYPRTHFTTNVDLKYFTTASGSKLLTSGWWGRSRHPNYLYVFCRLFLPDIPFFTF
jgi:protein-S-isoprenylcysteine O-methyltransferase Ste14